MNDAINPAHYKSTKIEPIEVIEDWGLGFCLGNAIKYIARAGKKLEQGMTPIDKEIEDLEKAAWYLNRHIETVKGCRDNVDMLSIETNNNGDEYVNG